MQKTKFIYTAYISAKPEKVWDALINPEFTAKYWQHENVSDWKTGSTWEHRRCDTGRTLDLTGKVVEYTRPRRLVLTWASPEDAARDVKPSKVALELEPYRGVTRLTIKHEALEAGSEMLKAITEGWPMVLSSLKSLLEAGQALPVLWEEEEAERTLKVKGCRP